MAESDLAVDPKTKAYLPAKGKARVVVEQGAIYLHNASGARKSSGAYYTKDFAVEHLLDHALEPALTDHLGRLDRLEPAPAADRFFDFRVADIAIGSGHFLVAAVDRIERRLSAYLATRALPGVRDELERLRRTATDNLGPDWIGDPLEDTQLLRRQIARRCIFGVDLNPLAVELARLSLWIHTFVPGLPLSFLDGNLVVGNSLVGIATLEEASQVFGATYSLFTSTAVDRLAKAREPLARLGRLAEATAAEVREARKLHALARAAIREEESLLTVLAASRIDPDLAKEIEDARVATRFEGEFGASLVRRAEKALAGLHAMHFPIVFPQVFLGGRPGFDVILGNPPWEKVKLEEHAFWARHFPGFRGQSQSERERELPKIKRSRPDLVAAFEIEVATCDALRAILLGGAFPGMGSGDPDLYKAFCWRFWQLTAAEGGAIGVVLPRSVFVSKGSEEFRRALLADSGATDLTTLVNNRGWVFDEVHPQFSVGLVAIRKGNARPPGELALRGPYNTRVAYDAGRVAEAARFPYEAVRSWTSSMVVPLLPSDHAGAVFTQMNRSPRFDAAGGKAWKARPYRELDATNDKDLYDFEQDLGAGYWPVCAGEAFDIWTPDTGKRYAVAKAKLVTEHLQAKRLSSARQARSVFSEFPIEYLMNPDTLPCRSPRIAFRDVTRATDSRTVRAALVPRERVLVHTAPSIIWPRGDRKSVV